MKTSMVEPVESKVSHKKERKYKFISQIQPTITNKSAEIASHLFNIIMKNNLTEFETCLNTGISLTDIRHKEGWNILHIIAKHDKKEMFDLLLKKQERTCFELCAMTMANVTPLMLSIKYNSWNCFQLFLSMKSLPAFLNLKDEMGKMAVDYAIYYNRCNMMEKLASVNIDWKGRNRNIVAFITPKSAEMSIVMDRLNLKLKVTFSDMTKIVHGEKEQKELPKSSVEKASIFEQNSYKNSIPKISKKHIPIHCDSVPKFKNNDGVNFKLSGDVKLLRDKNASKVEQNVTTQKRQTAADIPKKSISGQQETTKSQNIPPPVNLYPGIDVKLQKDIQNLCEKYSNVAEPVPLLQIAAMEGLNIKLTLTEAGKKAFAEVSPPALHKFEGRKHHIIPPSLAGKNFHTVMHEHLEATKRGNAGVNARVGAKLKEAVHVPKKFNRTKSPKFEAKLNIFGQKLAKNRVERVKMPFYRGVKQVAHRRNVKMGVKRSVDSASFVPCKKSRFSDSREDFSPNPIDSQIQQLLDMMETYRHIGGDVTKRGVSLKKSSGKNLKNEVQFSDGSDESDTETSDN